MSNDNYKIDQIGEYGDLTPSQAKELAFHTENRLKGKTIDDIIKLDARTIEKTMEIIKSDKVESLQLKVLLNNLLAMITNLTSTARELYNWQDKAYLTSIWNQEDDNIEMEDKNDLASQIQAIQDSLTQNYPELMKSDSEKDKNMSETVRQVIRDIITRQGIILEGAETVEDSIRIAVDEIRGYSVLTPLMNQPNDVPFEEFIEEIRVDDYNDIRVVIGGRESKTDIEFKSPEHAELFARKLQRSSDQAVEFSRAKPFMRLRVGAMTRVSMMRDPVAIRDANLVSGRGRPVIHMCIRRQRSDPFTSDKLMELGSINRYGDLLLKTLLKSGISMCFYGGTGTGKTSMFNAYMTSLGDERMITMAEVDEMKARRIDFRPTIKDENGRSVPNPRYKKAVNSVIMWEAPDPDKEIAAGLKWFTGMINAALTMTPYTIMIQETKGAEARALAEAAISDHQVLTTIHAKNEQVLINRIFKMMQQGEGNAGSEDVIFKDIVTAFPIVVGCSRLKDGSRKISSIVEYRGYIPSTKEIATNTMCKFVVERNVYIGRKLKVEGVFRNYGLPSDTLREEMSMKGMLESDWTDLFTEFRQTRSEKPEYIDRLTYEGDLYKDSSIGM